MKKLFITLAILLLMTSPVVAGFEEGVEAYSEGDFATALKEWVPLAEQGYADAQFELGVLYHSGQGVQKDSVLAYKWFNLAVAQDHEGAKDVLNKLKKMMTPAQIAEAQKLSKDFKQ